MAIVGVISELMFEVMGSAWEGILAAHGFIGERQASVVKETKDARKTMIFFEVVRGALLLAAEEAFGDGYDNVLKSSADARVQMIHELIEIWLPLPKALVRISSYHLEGQQYPLSIAAHLGGQGALHPLWLCPLGSESSLPCLALPSPSPEAWRVCCCPS